MNVAEKKQREKRRRFHLSELLGLAFVLVCALVSVCCVIAVLDTRRREETILSRMNDLEELVQVRLKSSQSVVPTIRREARSATNVSTDLIDMVVQTLRERCQFADFCGRKGERGLPGSRGAKGEPGVKGERGSKGDSGEISPTVSAIRLVGGVDEWEGRVEVYHNGIWGTVCDNHWDINDATVACRQLNRGYNGAASVKRGAYFGRGSGRIWMDNVQCIGTESSLVDCPFRGWGSHQCNHDQDAGVKCIGDIRLADGLRPGEGRVEVLHNGTWGTVCNNSSWNFPDGNVACRQLGYFGAKSLLQIDHNQERNTRIWMDSLGCTGDEDHLTECTFSGWSAVNQSCTNAKDAGLSCISDIRLTGGSKREEGRVEVLFNGTWGTVCDDGWDFNDAHVACQQLGYVRAKEYNIGSYFGRGDTDRVWMSGLNCSGKEKSLDRCRFLGWGMQNCTHNAGVVCVANIRLVGGALPEEGRVEVRYMGVWGTVCDDDWDLNDAHVACRELGYVRARAYEKRSLFGRSSGMIWMSGVSCTGSEARLSDCTFNGWKIHNCNQSNNAGVRCVADIRLSGGTVSSGRVEVLYDGTWNGVCDHEWDLNSAHVACRQLGYYRAKDYKLGTFYGGRTTAAWMSGLQCRGNETSLSNCAFSGWRMYSCGSAGVICSANFRLVGAKMPYEGRVEILYNGIWGTICDNDWGLTDAHVVCRELGYYKAKHYAIAAYFGSGSGPVWLDEVGCLGSENSLRSCPFAEWGLRDCSHRKDAGVVCAKPLMRLVGPLAPRIGRVEVLYRNTWGTVCDDLWDLKDANVLCRELGFPRATEIYTNAHFGSGSVTWMDDVQCKGFETNLTDCKFRGWGVENCSPSEDAGVACARRVRLVGGSSSNEGRVEVYYKGVWGTVCDNGWDRTDGHILCRELGFPTVTAVKNGSYFGEGTGPTWMSSVSCAGYESNLTDCRFPGWGVENCSHRRDAGVVCSTVRLANGSSLNEGRVEVYHRGDWGTVCDNNWNFTNAHVVCKELGFPTASAVKRGAFFGSGTGRIWMDNVSCRGHESNITHCNFWSWGVSSCSHANDVGVVCTTVRLLGNGPPHSGRVEVYHKGRWGTVCDIGWNWADGHVVCRELGFNTVAGIRTKSHYGQGSGPIWMSNVACEGDEKNLTDCRSLGWAVGNCNHSQDAGVLCARYRLVGGSSLNEGRVEVYRKGTWGSICNDHWDFTDAHVLCREMGFPTASALSYYGQGSGRVWMSGIACEGDEQNLTDCFFR